MKLRTCVLLTHRQSEISFFSFIVIMHFWRFDLSERGLELWDVVTWVLSHNMFIFIIFNKVMQPHIFTLDRVLFKLYWSKNILKNLPNHPKDFRSGVKHDQWLLLQRDYGFIYLFRKNESKWPHSRLCSDSSILLITSNRMGVKVRKVNSVPIIINLTFTKKQPIDHEGKKW